MNYTEDLKDKLKNAKTKEEADAILAEVKADLKNVGVELSDEELNQIVGGEVKYNPGADWGRFVGVRI
jgi:bacteriocin-like protein